MRLTNKIYYIFAGTEEPDEPEVASLQAPKPEENKPVKPVNNPQSDAAKQQNVAGVLKQLDSGQEAAKVPRPHNEVNKLFKSYAALEMRGCASFT